MVLTEKDYAAARERLEAGEGTDEDRRLVKHAAREKDNTDPPAARRPANPFAESGDDTLGDEEPDGGNQADDYEQMEYRDLQAAARNRELNASGSKADLIARLREKDAAERTADPELPSDDQAGV